MTTCCMDNCIIKCLSADTHTPKGVSINYGREGTNKSVGGITKFQYPFMGGSPNSRYPLWGGSPNQISRDLKIGI